MADSKSKGQTTEEHRGQTLETTDHDVIRA
jgi:hypothetical protein